MYTKGFRTNFFILEITIHYLSKNEDIMIDTNWILNGDVTFDYRWQTEKD